VTDLPPNVYHLHQSRLRSLPGNPWVYWISESLRTIYRVYPKLSEIAEPKQGLATGDNFRFLRFWWEVGKNKKASEIYTDDRFEATTQKWFPCLKGGSEKRWYGNQEYVINWRNNGNELRAFNGSVIRNPTFYYREGITWSLISSGKPSFRWIQPGWIITHKGPGMFSPDSSDLLSVISVLNSKCANVLLKTISPTIGFEIGELANLPFPRSRVTNPERIIRLLHSVFWIETLSEKSIDFLVSLQWDYGLQKLVNILDHIEVDEAANDQDVYDLYGIYGDERFSIEEEIEGGLIDFNDDIATSDAEGEEVPEALITLEELAIRWISYATGIALGRFKPGMPGELGSAVYLSEDFAIGSLPVPDETEFDELVGPSERFDYTDDQGGRHVFSRGVEENLRTLADTDGIATLDEGHPEDLPAKVETALELMLGEASAAEVIAAATDENHDLSKNLRKFLERDFFTRWHIKWYRKRPVYWLLQSPKKLYGVYLFHERLTKDTLFVVQRQYVDRKLNLTRQLRAEKRAQAEKAESARERRELNKEAENLETLLLDLEEFARRLKAITDRGYTPHIDDGVILNMAPLHEVFPAWSREPQKYWEGLERGEYEWAQLAMDYWPERVREKCRKDKSLAIAHGHEEWYEGR